MGVDYSSYVVIGCKVDEKKFRINKKVRGCDCKVDNIENMKFCSNCSKKVWEEDYDFIEGYEEDESFLGIPLVYNTDHRECWVPIYSGEADDRIDNIKLNLPKSIEELKAELKTKLEPSGLWDEDSFGIWCIQYCSY